jgi:secreted trypsin-like serine protease
MIRIVSALIASALLNASAVAMVGGAPPADEALARHVVAVAGQRGSACTGTALARDLVLTAAHCVRPGARYAVIEFDPPRRSRRMIVSSFERHPQFDPGNALARGETADLALLKLAEPLSARTVPAALGARDVFPAGDRFVVAGFGNFVVRGDGSFGTLRAAQLMAVRHPSSLQLRLADPATRGEHPGLGACSGDSGGPVFEDTARGLVLVAVVSWASSARGGEGCGGLTGATPIALHRLWISEAAKRLGGEIGP